MSTWEIFRREFRLMCISDPRRISFILGASLIYLFLFGMLYGTHVVTRVPIVIYDEDQTKMSRELIQAFYDSEKFSVVGEVQSDEDMENALREKQVHGAVSIPANFSQSVRRGLSQSVMVITNGNNLLITNTVTTAAQEIVSVFSRGKSVELAGKNSSQLPDAAEKRVAPVEARLRVLYNPTLSYLAFFLIGLAMAAYQQGIFLAVGASVSGDLEDVSEEIRQTKPMALIVGKLLPYWIVGMVGFVVTVLTAVQVFGVIFRGSWLELLSLAGVFTFAAIGFSSLMAVLCKSEVNFTRVSLIYTVPAFILSGHIWPLQAMTGPIQYMSHLFPLLYFADTVRELALAGNSPFIWKNMLILMFVGIGSLMVAGYLIWGRVHYGFFPDERKIENE